MEERVAVVVKAATPELAERAVQILNGWLCNSGEQDFFNTQGLLDMYGRGEEVMADYDFIGRWTAEGIYEFTVEKSCE